MRISDWSSDVCSSDLAGTIVGFIVGGEVGRSMDRADALCIDQALEHAGDGEIVTWTSDRQHYQVKPEGSFQTADGRYCREYRASSTVGSDTVQTYGTACRQPDGSWQRSEEHTSELQYLMGTSFAAFLLKKKKKKT